MGDEKREKRRWLILDSNLKLELFEGHIYEKMYFCFIVNRFRR